MGRATVHARLALTGKGPRIRAPVVMVMLEKVFTFPKQVP